MDIPEGPVLRADKANEIVANVQDRDQIKVQPDYCGLDLLPAETIAVVMSLLPAADVCRLGMSCRRLLECSAIEFQRCASAYLAAHGIAWCDDFFSFAFEPVARNAVDALRTIANKHDSVGRTLAALSDPSRLNSGRSAYLFGPLTRELIGVVLMWKDDSEEHANLRLSATKALRPRARRVADRLHANGSLRFPAPKCPRQPSFVLPTMQAIIHVRIDAERFADAVGSMLFVAAFDFAQLEGEFLFAE
eukprot:TRINITY_DN10724_c0_g1_i1.p1 TRINITY_DN10724_c0_g1~~TRINITY_DN10724_c0_g1_i1.p1  ORF type:complete len:248 (-),score=52.54 TRINITY_DN10724_c0_g1_i1:149-892(-)